MDESQVASLSDWSVSMRLLGDYAGRLITNGYEAYVQVVRQNGITQTGCWAHAGRKCVDEKVQSKGKTGKANSRSASSTPLRDRSR